MLDILAMSDAEMLDAHMELVRLGPAEYLLNAVRHLYSFPEISNAVSQNVTLLLAPSSSFLMIKRSIQGAI